MMGDLRFERPETTEQFAALMAAAGARLPFTSDPSELGVIRDADGNDVLTVDVNNERSDEEVAQIVAWVLVAVNTCGGFKAVGQPA